MLRTIVGVIRGGTSSEYPLSLKTGTAMMKALPEEGYDVRDILIDRSGLWHLRGSPSTPVRALAQVDVVLSALHGGVGEDGTVQRLLQRSGTPFAGSRPLPSGLALNKIRAREILTKGGVKMPRAVSFSVETKMTTGEMAILVFERFAPPYIVKPPTEGAGTGIRYAKSIVELPDAIGDVLDVHGAALVEEYIIGKEASVGLIERFRNEDLYALPPVHVDHGSRYLGPAAHQEGHVAHRTNSFTYEQKLSLADIARRAHTLLDLSHFSRADLIVTPRAIYLLEVNTTPGLYPGASFPSMLEYIGSSVTEYLEHSIGLALGKI